MTINPLQISAVLAGLLGVGCVSAATPAYAGEWRFHPERCPDLVEDVRGEQRGVNDPFAPDIGIPVFGLIVDMGAYERQLQVIGGGCVGDLTNDDLVGFNDLLEIISRWGPCP